MEKEMIIVLDFGGQYNQLIARRVRECNVYAEVHPYTMSIDEIKKMNPKGIIFTGGPNSVYKADSPSYSKEIFELGIPILGICLGHQCIGEAFGGVVSYAKELFHGKQSEITHDGQGIFKGIDSPVKVARYHSLAVQKESLPECLVVTAETEDGEIMAVRHKKYPVYGLQFHPESIYTEHGKRMIENFLGRTA